MSQTYFALLTAVGEAKLANAAALGTQLQISRMAVGDGNGVLPVPIRTQTALVHETYRADLNELNVDPLNASQIIAELVIPETEGGYWLREMGLYDAAGDLIAVANCPPSYKPQLAEGSGRTQIMRMVLIVSSTTAIQLKIDPSIVLATRAYVDTAKAAAIAAAANMIVVHMADPDPHPQYATKAELAAVDLIPPGHHSGLTLSNNVATPSTDVDIAAGVARGIGSSSLRLAAPITKRLQAAGAWAAGSGSNGLFTGARANNTWYNVFLIRNDATGAIDAGFDTSAVAANRPAGHSNFVLLGSIKTNGSGAILAFFQTGRSVWWKTPPVDVNVTGVAGSAEYVLSVPPGRPVMAHLNANIVGGDAAAVIRSPDITDIAPSFTTATYAGGIAIATGTAPDFGGFEVNVPTNSASKVAARNLSASVALVLVTFGYTEL